MDLKKTAKDAVNPAIKGMAEKEPFVAFMLVVIVCLLGWMIYINHVLQQQVIDIKLTDYKMERDRSDKINEFGTVLRSIQSDIKEVRDAEVYFKQALRDMRNIPCK